MADHVFAPSFQVPGDLNGRCPSPTKGVHKCVFCTKLAARVSEHAWKRMHPTKGCVPESVSVLPQNHSEWRNPNLGWRLFLWACLACMQSWYTYKYYLACDEVPASANDCLPPNPSTMRDLPTTPPGDASRLDTNCELFFGERGDAGFSNALPVRTSSLASKYWVDPRQMSIGSGNSAFGDQSSQFPPTPAYSATHNSAAADMAGAMVTAKYAERLFPVSMPVFSDADLAVLDSMTNQRHTLPAPEKKHKRGDNFDHSNYCLIRKRPGGACAVCKEKKRKCHPTHVHLVMSSSPSFSRDRS